MKHCNTNGLETVLEKVGRSLSERFGIRVICQGNQCCTDGRTIFLPSLPDDLPDELVRVIQGYLDHETGHILGRSNFRIGKWFGDTYGEEGFAFLNMLEDLRVEELMRRRFPGCRHNLEACSRFCIAEAGEAGDVPPIKQLAFGIHSRGNQVPDLPFVGQDVYAALDQIKAAVLRCPTARNTKEVARLAESAWPVVKALLDQHSQPVSMMGGGTGQTRTVVVCSPSQSKSDDQAQPAPGSGPGASSDQSADAENATGLSTGLDDNPTTSQSTNDLSSPPTPQPAASAPTGKVAVTTTAKPNAMPIPQGIMQDVADGIVTMVNRYAAASKSYRIWSTERDVDKYAPIHNQTSHATRMAELLPHVAGVRQKLLQTLLAEPKARWLPDKEYGYIDPHRLHRLSLPQSEVQGLCGSSGRGYAPVVSTRRSVSWWTNRAAWTGRGSYWLGRPRWCSARHCPG